MIDNSMTSSELGDFLQDFMDLSIEAQATVCNMLINKQHSNIAQTMYPEQRGEARAALGFAESYAYALPQLEPVADMLDHDVNHWSELFYSE